MKASIDWFTKSPKEKAELCPECGKVYNDHPCDFVVCESCGHLYYYYDGFCNRCGAE